MAGYSRRDFLKGAAGLALAGVAAPRLAGAAEDVPQAERRSLRLRGLDPAHDGLKVAQLSDLHVGARTPAERVRAAIDEANRFEPDLVVLTGDYVCHARSDVGRVREQLGGLRAPTVAVLGNHDHWVDARGTKASLESLGYAVLQNEHTSVTLRGEPFTVVGVDDLFTGHARPAEALKGTAPGGQLVLAHGPKTAEILRLLDRPVICLSGHTHGGQINIPGVTPMLLRALAHEPYDRGLFQLGAVQLYVNRGVGNSALRVRVNAPPEVTLITLRAA